MSQDIYKMNLELLLMAKELVINEYVDRRAEVHNKWLVESDHLWKTQRLRLAYPTIPSYPTEAEIINRAQKLVDFVANNNIVPVTVTSDDDNEIQEKVTEVATESALTTATVTVNERDTTEQNDNENINEVDENNSVSDKSETKNNLDTISEKILEYTAIKVASELKDGQPASSKIMTNILGKFKDITGKKET